MKTFGLFFCFLLVLCYYLPSLPLDTHSCFNVSGIEVCQVIDNDVGGITPTNYSMLAEVSLDDENYDVTHFGLVSGESANVEKRTDWKWCIRNNEDYAQCINTVAYIAGLSTAIASLVVSKSNAKDCLLTPVWVAQFNGNYIYYRGL